MKAAERQQLKGQAHSLKPVITVGQGGLSENILSEVEQALDTHQLIKIKIRAERGGRRQIQERICHETGAELVQSIGQIAVIYRKNPLQ